MFFPYRDDNPRSIVPFVTYLLLFLNCSVFIVQTLGPEEFTMLFAIIPKMSSLDFSHFFLSLFTSMFLHGSLVHLIGNMLYLWIFAVHI